MTQGINIILVDDENLARMGLALILKAERFNIVGEAENGQQLLKLLKSKKTDIILLDLEMPVMNGSATLKILRADYPEVKVIILSKYHDEELVRNYFNRGASAFLSKGDGDIRTICDAITRVFKYGIYKDNLPFLFKHPAEKDGHYYRLILTKREITVLRKIYEMKSFDEIARELYISPRTVENHAKSIYNKIKTKNRYEFGIIVTKLGLHYLDA